MRGTLIGKKKEEGMGCSFLLANVLHGKRVKERERRNPIEKRGGGEEKEK